jgi:hypothetical protein
LAEIDTVLRMRKNCYRVVKLEKGVNDGIKRTETPWQERSCWHESTHPVEQSGLKGIRENRKLFGK